MRQLSHNEQFRSISERVTIVSSTELEIDSLKYTFHHQQPIGAYFGEFKNFGANCEHEKQSHTSNFIQYLSSLLYSKFYCGLDEFQQNTLMPSKQERDQFMQQLSEANATTCGYDYFWQITSVDRVGNVFVSKNEEHRQLHPNSFVYADNAQNQPIVNSFVHIIRQKEQRDSQPVFYYVFGNELQRQQIEMVRIYFNIQPEGAAKLVNEISTVFNNYKIPFSFKCLNHPDLYNRNDSAVLYLDKLHVDVSILLLNDIVKSIDSYLKEATPWFTKQLHKGIAYAEDPGNGQSFGMNRCTLLANALWRAYKSNVSNSDDKLNFILHYLQSHGLQNAHPYLNVHTSRIPVFQQFQ